MSSRTGLHVAVVKGGRSAERQVSIISGRECAAALRRVGYKVSEVDAGNDLPKELVQLSPDIIFNALHGRYGEDGCVQGLFEWLELPYTHSGVQASALAMDKDTAKKIFKTENLPVAESICTSSTLAFSTHLMEPPYVIKPINEGSSVGVHLVTENGDNLSSLEKNFPDQGLVEKFSLGVDGLFLLEINTQPGMTPTSLSPEQARAKGISFDTFCNWIVEDASCNR